MHGGIKQHCCDITEYNRCGPKQINKWDRTVQFLCDTKSITDRCCRHCRCRLTQPFSQCWWHFSWRTRFTSCLCEHCRDRLYLIMTADLGWHSCHCDCGCSHGCALALTALAVTRSCLVFFLMVVTQGTCRGCVCGDNWSGWAFYWSCCGV